jgi:PAS domain S-box-containing protein
MIEYSLDITEQRRVEQVQKQQEEELKIILDSVPALIFYKDKNNRYNRVNRRFADIAGLPKYQIEGKSAADLFPEHAERSWQDDLEVVESEVPIRNILESVVVGDNTVWLQTDKIPYRDSSGNIVGIIGFSQDITKRKHSEETLSQKSRELGERVKELNCLCAVSQIKMAPNLSINQVIQGVANIIPPSWQYPEITCARIVWGEKTYTSDNFVESKWGQSADIVVSGEIEGKVEVYYSKEMPEAAENPPHAEERSLIYTVAESVGLYLTRKRIEIDLYASNLQLIAESKAQQDANTTLHGVLARIETEKKDNLLSVQSHVDRVVMPLLRQLRNGASDTQSSCISVIEGNLASITSPFVGKLESQYARLSPREVEISKYIKNGLSSKDIAALLHTSEGTVRNQRKSIRRKLGISSDKVSLVSFLRAI